MTTHELTRSISVCLLEERELSSFLRQAFEIYCQAKPNTTFAGLARKMGFSSRSFVRQLILGKRRPNLQNYGKIAFGFAMSPEATDYLKMLIERENATSGTSVDFDKKFNEAELKLRKSINKSVKRVRRTDPVPHELWPFVYAALGEASQGRTLEEISEISGQDRKVCIAILESLKKKDMIHWDPHHQKFFAKNDVIDIGELANSTVLKNLYKLLALETIRRIDLDLKSDESLFHSSVFSVRKEQLPQITRDLQKVLSSYMISSEDSSGRELALLCAGLVPLRN